MWVGKIRAVQKKGISWGRIQIRVKYSGLTDIDDAYICHQPNISLLYKSLPHFFHIRLSLYISKTSLYRFLSLEYLATMTAYRGKYAGIVSLSFSLFFFSDLFLFMICCFFRSVFIWKYKLLMFSAQIKSLIITIVYVFALFYSVSFTSTDGMVMDILVLFWYLICVILIIWCGVVSAYVKNF